MGARGNSGVIFSQIVRGAADVLGETDAPAIDADATARALRGATRRRLPRGPAARSRGRCSRSSASSRRRRRRAPPTHPALAELLVDLVRRGEDAVARTPEQLQVLKDAGVVDAGGAGLLELVRGVAAAVTGEPIPEAPAGGGASLRSTRSTRSCRATRTARSFSSRARSSTARRSRRELEQLGDSLLVVGDENAIKVHVHTDDPGAALSIGTRVGHDRPRSRSRTCTSRRTSARSACSRPFPMRRARSPASSRSSRAKGTGSSSRASPRPSARSRSSRAARR